MQEVNLALQAINPDVPRWDTVYPLQEDEDTVEKSVFGTWVKLNARDKGPRRLGALDRYYGPGQAVFFSFFSSNPQGQ